MCSELYKIKIVEVIYGHNVIHTNKPARNFTQKNSSKKIFCGYIACRSNSFDSFKPLQCFCMSAYNVNLKRILPFTANTAGILQQRICILTTFFTLLVVPR